MASEKKLIVESGKEYQILESGEKCPDCKEGKCETCGRENAMGEAKIPTGRKILNG